MSMPTGAWHDQWTGGTGFTDVAQWAGRGSRLATLILGNPNMAMADTWFDSQIVNSSFTAQRTVPNTYTANKGAQLITGIDTTFDNANFHARFESWNNAKNESYDSKGTGWGVYRWQCNYDCAAEGL